MRETVEILGVAIDKMTMTETLEKAKCLLKTPEVSAIFTPNPEIVMAAYEDADFCRILNSADICTPDGIGVVYASKIVKDPVPERVPGFDLTCSLLESMAGTEDSVFLFGAKPGVAETAGENMQKKYPGLKIAGTRDGYFKEEDEAEIIEQINSSGASLLLVCLGAPKQEKWIDKNRDKLSVNLCMGVGGTLDVFAGTAKRAPEFFIKCNLEWLYRICSHPSRIGRAMALPKFMLTVMKEK